MEHINITKSENIKGLSTGSGMVTRSNWSPGKGRQEAEDIARAKQKAFEEMMEAERLAANPELQRIEALEGEVKDLKNKLISFIELYGQK